MTTPRLNFDDIDIEKIPSVYPTMEELMSPNDINGFINNPKIYKIGMEYGMIKIVAPEAHRQAIVNNLEDKENDPNFKIKIREQVLNELELSNRSYKLFDKQLEAFAKISGVEHKSVEKIKVDDKDSEFHLYDLYVKIMTTYNSGDVDEFGRYLPKLAKIGKRTLKETNIDENQSTQKKRRSSRIKNTVYYNVNELQKQEGNENIKNSTAESNQEDDWKVPDPKTCRFLQIPMNKGNVQPSTHSLNFGKA